MKDCKNYYYKEMPDSNFCVDIIQKENFKTGNQLNAHWHEHIQLYYFTDGTAFLECNKKRVTVSSGSIVVINSNELHFLESLSDNLKFYVIRIDLLFLFSNQVDLCQAKFLTPLSQNLIMFKNLIDGDNQILECVKKTIQEYFSNDIGYELAVKSSIYQLIVLLLRKHITKILTNEEFLMKVKNLKRFDSVFKFLEDHYSEKINIKDLADQINISIYHFCRIFKQIAGKTTTNYINGLRMEKAAEFLKEDDLNITEISLKCGFKDINYFSRLFKKYYGISPTNLKKQNSKGLTLRVR